MSKYNYILDPGHGGINPLTDQYVTPGKRSPIWSDGRVYFEGVGNRAIVALIASRLKALNIDHSFTVKPNDWFDWPLGLRVKKANEFHKKQKSILISIHSNAGVEQAHGYEVYTSPGETFSDEIATAWFSEYALLFPELKGRKNLTDGDVDKESKFTIITATHCPAILIESMFHTNQKECAMLMDPVIQNRIADSVINTILKLEK